jgi:hypothetical protein
VRVAGILGVAALFLLLATANAGGYRYGASDQAFYAAAVLKARSPALFPRDTPLIETQTSLQVEDRLLGGLSRVTGLDLPALFLIVQVVTLLALAGAAVAFGRALGLSPWAIALFLALLTLRHHITKTGANTLEGYMHPRILAFAIGLGAAAAVLRRRVWLALFALAVAFVVHPTTAFWFTIAVGAALFVDRKTWRPYLLAGAVAAGAAAVWAVVAGPLAGRLVTMDPAWLAVLADRDYLFSSRWPLYAWAINLAYLVVIVAAYRARRARGVAVPAEGALVAGWASLVIVFLISVPFQAHGLALAIQAQVNRVFWLLDVAATAYIAWWLLAGPLGTTRARRLAVVMTVLTLSAIRGAYVVTQARGRELVAVTLPDSAWTRTMSWIAQQSPSWNVLADPGHAWKYGSSVRVAAARDTVLEAGKDPALALYSRALAMRVAEREQALSGFDHFTTEEVRRVAARFSADVVVAAHDQAFDLPVLYRNEGFTVYDAR